MPTVYSRKEIAKRLGLKAPLLMLDSAQLLLAEGDTLNCAHGVKYLSANEPVFAGHFPGRPILPGVLQVAAMAQASALLARALRGEQRFFLKALGRVKFRRPVMPGARMDVSTAIAETTPEGFAVFKASCAVDGAPVSGGTLVLAPYGQAADAPAPTADEAAPPADSLCGPEQILRVLPHRPPFLLVDGIYGMGREKERACGFKNLTAGDALLDDEADIYPPYLMVESAAQLCCANVLAQPENRGRLGLFMSIDKASFDSPVPLRGRLDMRAACQTSGRAGAAQVSFLHEGRAVGSADLKYILTDPETTL